MVISCWPVVTTCPTVVTASACTVPAIGAVIRVRASRTLALASCGTVVSTLRSASASLLAWADPLVRIHPLYRELARTAAERQTAYRALFRASLDPDFVDGLRVATNGGFALGNERFKLRIAKALKRRVAPLPRGRPHKRAKDQRN
jgi:hypothetical protein